MINKAFTHHGDAHGIKDGDPIMVALSKVTTHGTPHPNDDYFPLYTTWKPVPFRPRVLKNGVTADGVAIDLTDYLRKRQANRPKQSSMPTIKYVPAHQQARAAASRRDKPTRRAKSINKNPKKIQKGVNRVNHPTFGSKTINLMSVKQLEEQLMKELKCTVLPVVLEKPNPKNQQAKKAQANRARKAINKTVTEIISALDPYTLAHMASRSLFNDRNADSRLKTSLRHIVKQLLLHQTRTNFKQEWKEKDHPGLFSCRGCQNLHYTHTCDRKRRVAHCFMTTATRRDPDATHAQSSHQDDVTPDDENANTVTPDVTRSHENQDQEQSLPEENETPLNVPSPDIKVEQQTPDTSHRARSDKREEKSIDSATERLKETVTQYEELMDEVLEEFRTYKANVRKEWEPSQDRHHEEPFTPSTHAYGSYFQRSPYTDTDQTFSPYQNSERKSDRREHTKGRNSPEDPPPSDPSSDSSNNYSSSSDSSTSTDYSLPSFQDFNDPRDYARIVEGTVQKIKRHNKKRSKRRKHSADTIFRYLMKAVESYHLPTLNYDQNPVRRRGKFNHFLDKLKLVTSGVKETRKLLTDTTKPKRPSKNANLALFRILCARVDGYLRNQLQDMSFNDKEENGYKALLLLQSLFADKEDMDYKLQAETEFRTITLRNNEPIYDFNKRFGILYRNMVGAEVRMTENDRIRIYLRALRDHTDAKILFDVKNMTKDFEAGNYIPLIDMQRILQREDDRNNGFTRQETKPDRNSRPRRRHTAHANQALSKKTLNGQFPYSCYGCQQVGHMLKECRTTSEGDKQRIYDMMRATRNSPKMGLKATHPKLRAANQATAKSPKWRPSSPYPTAISAKPSKHQTKTKPSSTTKTTFSKDTKLPPLTKPPKMSYAAAALRAPKKRIAHANVATTLNGRRIAYCGSASTLHHPVESDVEDPFEKELPPLYDDQVVENPNVQTVLYEDCVVIDSGASDCMSPLLRYLTLIRNVFAAVCLADGTLHDVNYQGKMCIRATDIRTGRPTVIPMLETLYVPGLKNVLWSVSALTEQGHQVIFGFSTVRIVLHADSENPVTIHLNKPILTDNGSVKFASHAQLTFVKEDSEEDQDWELTGIDGDDDYAIRCNEDQLTQEMELLTEPIIDRIPTNLNQAIPSPSPSIDNHEYQSSDDAASVPSLLNRYESSSDDDSSAIPPPFHREHPSSGDKDATPKDESPRSPPNRPSTTDLIGNMSLEHYLHHWEGKWLFDNYFGDKRDRDHATLNGDSGRNNEVEHSVPMFPHIQITDDDSCASDSYATEDLPPLISRPRDSSSDSDSESDSENLPDTPPRARDSSSEEDSDEETTTSVTSSLHDAKRNDTKNYECYLKQLRNISHDPPRNTPVPTHPPAWHYIPPEHDYSDTKCGKEGGGDNQTKLFSSFSNSTPYTVAPAFQVIPPRPPRPIPPPTGRWSNLLTAPTTPLQLQQLRMYESAFDDYMRNLKKFQRQNRRPNEPKVYDPDDYPSVWHVNGIPQRVDYQRETPRAHYDREQARVALQAFNNWDIADNKYTHWLTSIADGKGIRIKRQAQANEATAIPSVTQRSTQEEDSNSEEQESRPPTPTRTKIKKPVSLELMHRRLGHRSTKAIFAAEDAQIYDDVKIAPEHDKFCATCKISTIRAANRGPPKEEPRDPTKPGRTFFLDVQPNKARQALTRNDFFENYLGIACDTTSFYKLMGLNGTKTSDAIDALETFATRYKPFDGYTLYDHCEEIHVDDDSPLNSEEMKAWCDENHIKLVTAGAHHQSMNGKVEVMWQTARKMAFSLCNNARLGWSFVHHSLMYATDIMEVLPAQGCVIQTEDGPKQSCPKAMWYQKDQVSVGRYRVFGCPVVAKIYARKAKSSLQATNPKAPRFGLTPKNVIQRGVRGIFLGLPRGRAGWLVYVPQSGRVFASADVAFDEDFDSVGLAFDKMLFYDSMPIRGAGRGYIDNARQYAYTGPPKCVDFSADDSDQEQYEASRVYADEVTMFDTFELVDDMEDSSETSSDENSSSESDDAPLSLREDMDPDHWDIPPLESPGIQERESPIMWDSDYTPIGAGAFDVEIPQPQPRRSKRIREAQDGLTGPRDSKKRAYAAHVIRTVETLLEDADEIPLNADEHMMDALTDLDIDAPGSDPTPFQQVPTSIRQVDQMPPEVAKAWIKSFVKEVKGILVDRKACAMVDPEPSDTIVPIMDVYRCKFDLHGLLDKLKTRCVFRGDLYDPAEPLDPWNPHASFLALKTYLAKCAREGIFPSQVDYQLAYLQADMRERVFVQFPGHWKKYLPNYLHPWIGRPLLLLKALYGYNYSGKFLYLDQAEFLTKNDFEQIMPGFWLKRLENNKIIMFLHYVDDILVASDDDVAKEMFLAELTTKFEAEVRPLADWYLQTRIQQDKDLNITLDQTRYAKAMVKRFLPNIPEEASASDIKKFESPMRREANLSKEDNSNTKEEVQALEQEYGFKYLALIGCFNWLSYTCYEELYAVRKLCRFMNLPGRPHFQAAMHLLHHFRCHPPKPLIFYHDIESAPITQVLNQVPGFRENHDPTYVVFADSSHGDADGGRSTACHLQVLQGGLIEHTSWVPNPVPLSTAESENNCYSVAIMRVLACVKTITALFLGNATGNVTVPILVDSSAAISMNTSEQPTRRTRHVESRFWFGKQAIQEGRANLVKVDGKTQQAADIGTKNFQAQEARPYLELFEAPYYT